MARFGLSTDILSPLNSDISLNDGSFFSFGSLSGTPVFDSNITSPICSANTQDTSLLYARNVQECASAFDEITNDIKKQSSINSEKEGKCKETYEDLKKSMDDLFGKDLNLSGFSSQLKDKSKNANLESKMHPKTSEFSRFRNPKNSKLLVKNKCLDPENITEVINKKSEKSKKETSVTKPKNPQNQSKQASSTSESLKGTKSRTETSRKNDTIVNEKKDALVDKKKISKIISKNDRTVEVKKASSKSLPQKKKDAGTEVVKEYNFKCQKKIPVSGNTPAIEKKNLSIEKSIQLAVSMETDNIRRFVLQQNLFLHKDLQNLQEMVKKQNEVTEYLFSVIDELLDTNKKLISKCK